MTTETFLLDTIPVGVRDMDGVDIALLLALSVNVGWSHRAEDWELMREVGHGLVVTDEAGRVHGSAMWFPQGEDFATIGMVITSARLQTHGGAQWLMNHVLERVQGRALGLHATTQSHRLFLSLRFVDEGTVYLRQGRPIAPPELSPANDAEVRALHPADLDKIRELDQLATGLDRRRLVGALASRSTGTVLVRQGRIEACALKRPFGRGSVIGPVFAGNEEDALRVIRPLIAEHTGQFLRIDIDQANGPIADFLDRSELPVRETVTRMSLGRPWPFARAGAPVQVALASHATG